MATMGALTRAHVAAIYSAKLVQARLRPRLLLGRNLMNYCISCFSRRGIELLADGQRGAHAPASLTSLRRALVSDEHCCSLG